MPVVFGTLLAVVAAGAEFRWGLFVLALIAMLLLHAAANILNDAADFSRGVDRRVLPGSGAVVRNLLSVNQAYQSAALLFALGSMLGVFIAAFSSWSVVVLGIIGVALGAAYSAGGVGLKYKALGDFTVLITFGLLGCLGAWTVQTGSLSWAPIIWALPQGLLVVAILHANNWRDLNGDGLAGFSTVAVLLGNRGSERYYVFLVFAPFLLMLFYALTPGLTGVTLPWPEAFLLVFLALPLSIRLFRQVRRRASGVQADEFAVLDGATAHLNLVFGLLCIIALLLQLALGKALPV